MASHSPNTRATMDTVHHAKMWINHEEMVEAESTMLYVLYFGELIYSCCGQQPTNNNGSLHLSGCEFTLDLVGDPFHAKIYPSKVRHISRWTVAAHRCCCFATSTRNQQKPLLLQTRLVVLLTLTSTIPSSLPFILPPIYC
eukprot:scaffold381_cov178-Amphora_coffeaeformis.AAC.16